MASRITDQKIQDRVGNMQRHGMDVDLDGQYGRYRVTNRRGDRNLSERAPNREIWGWLEGYMEGFMAAKKALLMSATRSSTVSMMEAPK